jgi:hypothetical protein
VCEVLRMSGQCAAYCGVLIIPSIGEGGPQRLCHVEHINVACFISNIEQIAHSCK